MVLQITCRTREGATSWREESENTLLPGYFHNVNNKGLTLSFPGFVTAWIAQCATRVGESLIYESRFFKMKICIQTIEETLEDQRKRRLLTTLAIAGITEDCIHEKGRVG